MPEIGDTAFEVEWPNGYTGDWDDFDPSLLSYGVAICATLEEARAKAREVFPTAENYVGCVHIHDVEYVRSQYTGLPVWTRINPEDDPLETYEG